MVDVFISYPRAARARVEPIKTKLESLGVDVFFDAEGIDSGDDFPDVINRAVKSASAVLGCWTKEAFDRPWVRRECRVGLIRKVLVAVALEPLDELDPHVTFIDTDYHDLSDWDGGNTHDGWRRTLRSLSGHLGRDLADISAPRAEMDEHARPESPIVHTPPATAAIAQAAPRTAPAPSAIWPPTMVGSGSNTTQTDNSFSLGLGLTFAAPKPVPARKSFGEMTVVEMIAALDPAGGFWGTFRDLSSEAAVNSCELAQKLMVDHFLDEAGIAVDLGGLGKYEDGERFEREVVWAVSPQGRKIGLANWYLPHAGDAVRSRENFAIHYRSIVLGFKDFVLANRDKIAGVVILSTLDLLAELILRCHTERLSSIPRTREEVRLEIHHRAYGG